MVKMDESAHAILKKWKEKLREKGVRVSLGGALREMDKIIGTNNDISRKDFKALVSAVEILKKYRSPTFSDAIGEMDLMIKDLDLKGFDYMKGRYDGD
jgi:hypothetical protein